MISKERFQEIEYETEAKYGFGCGYWNVCDDHACACVLSSKGFTEEAYASMERQQEKDMENFEREMRELDELLDRYREEDTNNYNDEFEDEDEYY